MERKEGSRNPKVDKILRDYLGMKMDGMQNAVDASEFGGLTPQEQFEVVVQDFENYLEQRRDPSKIKSQDDFRIRDQELGDLSDEEIEYIIERLRAD